MLTSTQVNQMTVAMFGAASAGYTEELQAFETVTALGDFLATLDLATEKFADATSDLATARIIAGDFGLADNDEAVQQVIDWLEAGESLGTIYAAAIEYLSGDSVAPDFVEAAANFNTTVTGAVAFSEANPDLVATDGDIAALQAGVTATSSNLALTDALDAYSAAQTALADNVEAWGLAQSPVVDPATEANVYEAVDTAEGASAAAAAAIAGVTAANALGLNTVEADTAAGYDSSDVTEDASVSVVNAEIARQEATYDTALSDAVTALEAVSATDTAGSLKALIDSYVVEKAAYDSAVTTAATAATAVTTKEASAELAADEVLDTVSPTANYAINVAASPTTLTFTDAAAPAAAATTVGMLGVAATATVAGTVGEYVGTYNAATNAWTWTYDDDTSGGSAAAAVEVADSDDLTALLADSSIAELEAAVVAQAEADAAVTAAGADVVAVLEDIEAVDGGLTSGGPASAITDTLTGAASGYTTAVSNIETFDEAVADFNDALADVTAARADAAATAALSEAATAATDAITDTVADGGLAKNLVAWGAAPATSANDDLYVVTLGTDATIAAGFGSAGTDSIYFGTDVYTLVEIGTDDTIATSLGDVNALEIFWDIVGGELTLYVEDETFGGTATGTNDVTTIILTGVGTADDVVFADNYLSISA